jgi:NADP-dependent 3-hydroxy acid dehydrogenase YdfG
MDVRSTVALITGASSGIGRAIAHALASEGATVALAARDERKLREIAAGLPRGARSLVLPTDVSDEHQVRAMVDRTVERFGRIDLLVNNAGFGLFKPITELTSAEFDDVINVNLRAPFLCMKYVLPGMYARKSGTVVTISSVAGRHGFAGGGAYCSSKFGVMGLTECAFQEARSRNVRIVTICPGSVDTAFFDEAHTTAPNRETILKPEDVAETVLLALALPERALVRELDIRPTNPARAE